MKRFIYGTLAILAVAACGEKETSKVSEVGQALDAKRYIVMTKVGASSEAVGAYAEELGGKADEPYTHVLNGFPATLTKAQADKLAEKPGVEGVYEVPTVQALGEVSNATWGTDVTDGIKDRTYGFKKNGSGVTAYILDTGIHLDHAEFEGRAASFFEGYPDKPLSSCPNSLHGTHVAGTVGSKTYGVAPGVKLRDARVLSCDGYGGYDVIVRALDKIAREHKIERDGPAVVNMSLGGAGRYRPSNEVIRNLSNLGIPVVVAAGNSSGTREHPGWYDACNDSPAGVEEAITVGNIVSDNSVSYRSSVGKCLDIFAPGTDILSTGRPGQIYYSSGTSMASPHVAGAVALMLSENPTLKTEQIVELLTETSSKDVIKYANDRLVKQSPNRLLRVGWNNPKLNEDLRNPNKPPVTPEPPPVTPEPPTPPVTPDPCKNPKQQQGCITPVPPMPDPAPVTPTPEPAPDLTPTPEPTPEVTPVPPTPEPAPVTPTPEPVEPEPSPAPVEPESVLVKERLNLTVGQRKTVTFRLKSERPVNIAVARFNEKSRVKVQVIGTGVNFTGVNGLKKNLPAGEYTVSFVAENEGTFLDVAVKLDK